jgi:hypothetical protein
MARRSGYEIPFVHGLVLGERSERSSCSVTRSAAENEDGDSVTRSAAENEDGDEEEDDDCREA